MNLDDEVRAVMSAHGDNAPTELRWTPPAPRHRRPVLLPALAATAVAVIAAVLAIALSTRSTGRPHPKAPAATHNHAVPMALTCPARLVVDRRQRISIPPTAPGVDRSARLAPAETPRSVVVCAYLGDSHVPPPRLSGARRLTGDLAAVARTLTWQPRQLFGPHCGAVRTPLHDNAYLIGLTYPQGTLWVSAPGHQCTGATNGRFTTRTNLGAVADEAYRSGVWPIGTPQARAAESGGRLGQELAMVPAGSVGLVIHVGPRGGPSRAHSVPGDIGGLVATLNRPKTSVWNGRCSVDESVHGPLYQLDFSYRSGPNVEVTVDPGCRPAVFNGAVQTRDASTVVPVIRALLKRR